MFLLATNKRDITTDFIVAELRRRSLPFERLNTEDLGRATARFRPQEGSWEFELNGRRIALDEVTAAYYRRPGIPLPSAHAATEAAQDYCVEEWSAVLRSIWNRLEGRWLNSPFEILRAEDKPRQLTEAAAVGFRLPDTLVTNDFEAADAFIGRAPTIGKPLRKALVEAGQGDAVLFTSRVEPLVEEDRPGMSMAPVIFQREVVKDHDVRVTVVGTSIFAVAIHSQGREETSVDWRKGARPDLLHEIIDLPPEVEARCIALARRLGLTYGAIDLILDQQGEFWFLEINPNGQWAWIEHRTGAPVAAAIVDRLIEIAGRK